jgi:hypothetical protein
VSNISDYFLHDTYSLRVDKQLSGACCASERMAGRISDEDLAKMKAEAEKREAEYRRHREVSLILDLAEKLLLAKPVSVDESFQVAAKFFDFAKEFITPKEGLPPGTILEGAERVAP